MRSDCIFPGFSKSVYFSDNTATETTYLETDLDTNVCRDLARLAASHRVSPNPKGSRARDGLQPSNRFMAPTPSIPTFSVSPRADSSMPDDRRTVGIDSGTRTANNREPVAGKQAVIRPLIASQVAGSRPLAEGPMFANQLQAAGRYDSQPFDSQQSDRNQPRNQPVIGTQPNRPYVNQPRDPHSSNYQSGGRLHDGNQPRNQPIADGQYQNPRFEESPFRNEQDRSNKYGKQTFTVQASTGNRSEANRSGISPMAAKQSDRSYNSPGVAYNPDLRANPNRPQQDVGRGSYVPPRKDLSVDYTEPKLNGQAHANRATGDSQFPESKSSITRPSELGYVDSRRTSNPENYNGANKFQNSSSGPSLDGLGRDNGSDRLFAHPPNQGPSGSQIMDRLLQEYDCGRGLASQGGPTNSESSRPWTQVWYFVLSYGSLLLYNF